MPSLIKVTIRGKPINVVGGSKADIARALLDADYTVSEIAKAVPMAYSQVHAIQKKELIQRVRASVVKPKDPLATPQAREKIAQANGWGDPKFGKKVKTKPAASPIKRRPGIGKLRTPGLPSDIDVGECANCGFDLVVRPLPTGYTLIHVNASAEEYLNTLQFCQAMPKVLL